MKQFFKFMFASMLGTLLSIFLGIIIVFLIILGMVSSLGSSKEVFVSNNSVLMLKLDEPISERSSGNPFENFDYTSFSPEPNLGLNDILASIKKAKTDNRIKGIYLELSSIPAGIGTLEEIRNAIIDFKTSKKFVLAFSESFSQTAYYLASAANELYLYPTGILDFRGLKAEMLFFKGTFDKLEIEPQIIRHGKFKSAVEPLIMDKMSPENRAQFTSFLNSIWNHLIKNISNSRGISESELLTIANNNLIEHSKDAVKYKMIDGLAYKDEILSNIRKKIGLKDDKKISFVTLNKYSKTNDPHQNGFTKEKIAVIYAAGDIESGKGTDNTIGSDNISAAIRKARLDSNIKAIVLRVNSPGGSALASDVIWREVSLAKKVKPVIASMGDYAASGGYYISCAANKIVSEPTTITGSIGVFGVLLNYKKLLNNKLGITTDTVKTGKYADLGTWTRPLTASERMIVQRSVENIYDDFITKVAENRNMSKAQVDSIGQGRVWSAIEAKNIGLVDELGGIDKAIKMAADMAGIKNYRIVSLPEQKEAWVELIEKLSGDAEQVFFKKELREGYKYYSEFSSLLKMKGIQARLPYSLEIY
jgi:protease IV